MPRFEVEVVRKVFQVARVIVEADDEKGAYDRAEEVVTDVGPEHFVWENDEIDPPEAVSLVQL